MQDKARKKECSHSTTRPKEQHWPCASATLAFRVPFFCRHALLPKRVKTARVLPLLCASPGSKTPGTATCLLVLTGPKAFPELHWKESQLLCCHHEFRIRCVKGDFMAIGQLQIRCVIGREIKLESQMKNSFPCGGLR